MVNRVHLFEHVGLEVFLAALDADSGRNVTYDHQALFAAIVVVDCFLDDFAAAI